MAVPLNGDYWDALKSSKLLQTDFDIKNVKAFISPDKHVTHFTATGLHQSDRLPFKQCSPPTFFDFWCITLWFLSFTYSKRIFFFLMSQVYSPVCLSFLIKLVAEVMNCIFLAQGRTSYCSDQTDCLCLCWDCMPHMCPSCFTCHAVTPASALAFYRHYVISLRWCFLATTHANMHL